MAWLWSRFSRAQIDLCVGEDDTLRGVVLSGASRSFPGNRCAAARVADRLVVRFSPVTSDSPCCPQGGDRTLQGSTDSSQMARETLVPGSSSSCSRTAVASGRSDLAPQTSNSAVVGVANLQPQPEELDEAVIQTIRSARAFSTWASYSQKWTVFSDWCYRQQVDPATCSVHLVLHFLQSLLDSGKASSTMCVYVCVFSCNFLLS